MEIFDVNSCSEEHIDLKTPEQLESLLNKIKDSEEIMVRWEEDKYDSNDDVKGNDDGDEVLKKSQILITDGLMSRIKDGRLRLTSSKG